MVKPIDQPSQPNIGPSSPQPSGTQRATNVYYLGKSALLRSSLDENKDKLIQQFKDGVYVRTFSDPDFEMKEVIKEKLNLENDQSKIEKYYWASASLIQENSPFAVWEGTGERCGLVLSSEAELGGWNMQDMGTENPKKEWDSEKIRKHFPDNFPEIAFVYVAERLNSYSNDPVSQDLVRSLLKLDPETSILPMHFKQANEYFMDRLDKEHSEHADLLDRLPNHVKSAYNIESVQRRVRDLAKKLDLSKSYNEGKIRYKPKDILGIFVFNDPKSIDKAKNFHKDLESEGISVPFVSYQPRLGKIEIFEKIEDIPQTPQGPITQLPSKGTPEYRDLKLKYYGILGDDYPDDKPLNTEDLIEWLKQHEDYDEYAKEVEDIDFPSFLSESIIPVLQVSR